MYGGPFPITLHPRRSQGNKIAKRQPESEEKGPENTELRHEIEAMKCFSEPYMRFAAEVGGSQVEVSLEGAETSRSWQQFGPSRIPEAHLWLRTQEGEEREGGEKGRQAPGPAQVDTWH